MNKQLVSRGAGKKITPCPGGIGGTRENKGACVGKIGKGCLVALKNRIRRRMGSL